MPPFCVLQFTPEQWHSFRPTHLPFEISPR
jgi:hypothetical protein